MAVGFVSIGILFRYADGAFCSVHETGKDIYMTSFPTKEAAKRRLVLRVGLFAFWSLIMGFTG